VTLRSQESPSKDDLNYFLMTQRMVQAWVARDKYTIEPDFSSASYFWAVEHIFGGKVIIERAGVATDQVDGRFRDFLQRALSPEQLSMMPPTRRERPSEVSRAYQLGDSIMTLVICTLFGWQPLRVVGAAGMRLQETDRIKAMVTELRRVGARAEEREDGFTVWPAEMGQLHGADIETYNDHRMAMCFAVLGLKVPGIRIKNPGCVSKTFPNFFDKLEQLRT